uniref:CCHC-type domain-containing protein n=1 Tax=Ananas comosus var. bracteatus TaxID=296719 RepID=A0A6V7NGF5_ANACO|nr:unnamed protein product [Ananas comosus var. bracteatus]
MAMRGERQGKSVEKGKEKGKDKSVEKGKEKIVYRPVDKTPEKKSEAFSFATQRSEQATVRGVYAPSTSAAPVLRCRGRPRSQFRVRGLELRSLPTWANIALIELPLPREWCGQMSPSYSCLDSGATPKRLQSLRAFPATPDSISRSGRCFRCLGFDHRVSNCRGPIRCLRCYKSGHIARACMDRLPMSVYRAMRARPSYLSAFVPLTEDFHTRQNHCRNAILVDVLPPKNLGHFPQETIANRLASRFGGFPSDFHVARYSERDFVIFLSEWVPCYQLLRREILTLDDLRLQCYPWSPWSGARAMQLTYNVWIRLVSLPYECWSSRTVAALVGGFGRFIRADDFSVRMVDLTGYRCLVAVNYLSDILENLEITVGDWSRSVLIQMERWGRRDLVAPGNPPHERTDQHDPLQRAPDAHHHTGGSVRGRRSSTGGSSNSDVSWNSSEIRDRRREMYSPIGPPVNLNGRIVGRRLKSTIFPRTRQAVLGSPWARCRKAYPRWAAVTGYRNLFSTWENRGSIRPKIPLSTSSAGSGASIDLMRTPVSCLSGLTPRGLRPVQVWVALGPNGAVTLPGSLGRGHLRLLCGAQELESQLVCLFGPIGPHLVMGLPGDRYTQGSNDGREGPGPGANAAIGEALNKTGTSDFPQGPANCNTLFSPGLTNRNTSSGSAPSGAPCRVGHQTASRAGASRPERCRLAFRKRWAGISGVLLRCFARSSGRRTARLLLGGLSLGRRTGGESASRNSRSNSRRVPVHLLGTPSLGRRNNGEAACRNSGPAVGDFLVTSSVVYLSDGGLAAKQSVISLGAADGESFDNPPLVPCSEGEADFPPVELRGPTRSSARLGSSAKDSALERAKRRKAIRLEGETSSSTTLARKWNSRKIMEKSARCGVKLTQNDAVELHNFMLSG